MILGAMWRIVRLPVVTLLVIAEPLVRIVFSGLALLLILTTLFFKAIHLAQFPTWMMLGLAIGCALTVSVYRGVIVLLSR